MKNTYLLSAVLAAAIGFSFVWQTTPQQQASKSHTKLEELRSSGFSPAYHAPNAENIRILKAATVASMPYTLDVAAMDKPLHKIRTIKDKAITSLVNDHIGSFSRAPMLNYEYVATVGSNENFNTVIYRSANSYGDGIYPAYYTLCTISDLGQIIDGERIAALYSPLSIRTAVINADGTVSSKDIKQTWETDPLVKGYKDNKVVKSEVTREDNFRIDTAGKIIFIKVSPASEARNGN
ncbi:MAG: Tetratricopeptide repeat-containing protein [Bacteroidetes bacterium]|nr:Tetratricopeptide repeat-containing protein [Bacteroidota bacterium]